MVAAAKPDEDEQYRDYPSDGLPARVVGDWSEDKHYYLGHYIDIFGTGMHKKWPSRAFIDLFAGPGVCYYRENGRFRDGSPLLALKAKFPFTEYHFSDLDPTAISTLKTRCEDYSEKAAIRYYEKDCNDVAGEIADRISSNTICLAFIDPTGLDVKLSTIETLTRDKRMDLIIHFAIGTSIKRNIEKWYNKERSKIDDFFGGDEWRPIYEQKLTDYARLTNGLLTLYKKKLTGIGYTMEPDQAVEVKNTNNVTLYNLLFASKSIRGNEFWKKIKQIESNSQRNLPFD